MIPPSSLPRSTPHLRWSLEGLPTPDWIPRMYAGTLPFALTPVLFDGRLLVRSRLDEAWAAFDLTTGAVLARALLRAQVERCSAPTVAPDGRVAVVVFRSLADGFSLEEYEADGTHRWSCPLPFPYATTEGPTPADMGVPDYLPGPGSILAPHAGPSGMWIACAEEWVSNNAPWKTAAVRSGDPQVVWTRSERMLGATAEVGFFCEWQSASGVDLISGTSRWRAEGISMSSEVDVAGTTVAFSGYHDRESFMIQLAVFDANSGTPRFRATTRSAHRKVTWVSPERVVFHGWDGQIEVFALDGERIAFGTSPHRIVAFDGKQILVASQDAITCGPASAPEAPRWTIDASSPAKDPLAVAAESGWLALCDRTSGTLRVYGPPDLPAALLGALFVAEDGKLACLINRGNGSDGEAAHFLTTVWAGIGGPVLLGPVATQWHPATSASSEHAIERLGRLEAELGIVGAGDLYHFYVVRRNPDHATFGDKEWIAALPETPLAELRLFPEYGSSPYTPYDWDWQDGWWYPYSTFRPATEIERGQERGGSGRDAVV